MAFWIIFVVLPVVLIALSFRIRPLVPRGRGEQSAFNQSHNGAMSGLFGGHGLEPDPMSIKEDTEPVTFRLDGLTERRH